MCLFSARAWKKIQKGASRKTRHNPAFCGEMVLVGHRIQIWNRLGLDHKRKITLHSDFTLFFFMLGSCLMNPFGIMRFGIWNLSKNHQGCETIKMLFLRPPELFWISTVKTVWRRKANYSAGKNWRPWLRFSNSQEENIRRFYCSLLRCLWELTAANRNFRFWQ